MNENAYAVYHQSIELFLEAHVRATPGQLHYHINAPQSNIEQCLAAMLERGQVEQCGTAQESPAYLGQPLYCLKQQPYQAERSRIERHLDGANEELLGLHRYGAMTYPQYTDIADLLVEARERLKKHFQASATGGPNHEG